MGISPGYVVLCGGSATKADVIRHIDNDVHEYKVNNRTEVMSYTVDGIKHIKTVPNGAASDNLDNLPDC